MWSQRWRSFLTQIKISHTLNGEGQWPVSRMWEADFLSNVVCLTPWCFGGTDNTSFTHPESSSQMCTKHTKGFSGQLSTSGLLHDLRGEVSQVHLMLGNGSARAWLGSCSLQREVRDEGGWGDRPCTPLVLPAPDCFSTYPLYASTHSSRTKLSLGKVK